MKVYWYAMDDVEEDILHEADDIFIIIMAFDWREHTAENAVDRPSSSWPLIGASTLQRMR